MGNSWRDKFYTKKNRGLGLPLWESILREGEMLKDEELEEECGVCDDKECPGCEEMEETVDQNEVPTRIMKKGGDKEDKSDEEEDEIEKDLPPWLKSKESVTHNSYSSGEGSDSYKKKGKKGGVRSDPPKPTK